MVAETYLDNPVNYTMVNHKDEVKTHNWVNNLEWCNQRYNNTYSLGHKVKCVETGEVFNSIAEAGEKMNIKSHTHIGAVCSGKRKTCGGYHWEYA